MTTTQTATPIVASPAPPDDYTRCQFCGAPGAPLRRVTDSTSHRRCWDSEACDARQEREARVMLARRVA